MRGLLDKSTAWVEAYHLLLADHPLAGGLYMGATFLLVLLFGASLVRGQVSRAFWSVCALLLLNIVWSIGEDTEIHVYRTIVLADQIRHGALSLFVTDAATGDSLPVFVFYSFTPYLLPAILDLLGLSGYQAVAATLSVTLLVMVFGVRRVVESVSAGAEDDSLTRDRYLAAILFVGANYVFGLWAQRGALAEIWVYSLVPWVVVAMSSPRRKWVLAALLFFQISMHPVVFVHGLVCALAVAVALSPETPTKMVARCVLPCVIAIVAGAPFWLPPFLFKASILGLSALPVQFQDTFLSVSDLLSRRNTRSLGWFMPLAILVTAFGFHRFQRWRYVLLASSFLLIVLLQTTYLRPVAINIPLLHHSVFVWRLMLAAAFLGFGALMVAGQAKRPTVRGAMTALAVLSTLNAVVTFLGGAPAAIGQSVAAPRDPVELRDYAGRNRVWGRLEYMPDYSRLSVDCAVGAESVTFADLRNGVVATTPYIRVPNGPVGLATYSVNGARQQSGACGADLVLGPLAPGAAVQASEGPVMWLLVVRAICVALGLAALGIGLAAGAAREEATAS
jgi:hypothetical protein